MHLRRPSAASVHPPDRGAVMTDEGPFNATAVKRDFLGPIYRQVHGSKGTMGSLNKIGKI